MVHSHVFVHVQVIGMFPEPGQIAPDEVPVFVTGRRTGKGLAVEVQQEQKRNLDDQQVCLTHSLASTQPGL